MYLGHGIAHTKQEMSTFRVSCTSRQLAAYNSKHEHMRKLGCSEEVLLVGDMLYSSLN